MTRYRFEVRDGQNTLPVAGTADSREDAERWASAMRSRLGVEVQVVPFVSPGDPFASFVAYLMRGGE